MNDKPILVIMVEPYPDMRWQSILLKWLKKQLLACVTTSFIKQHHQLSNKKAFKNEQ